MQEEPNWRIEDKIYLIEVIFAENVLQNYGNCFKEDLWTHYPSPQKRWVDCCGDKANCPHVGPGSMGGMSSVGGLSKGS